MCCQSGVTCMTGEKSLYEIVGIVEDGKYDSLTESPQPAMFFPLAQSADSDTTVIVRSALPPAEVARALHRTLTSIDPDLPFTIRNWPDELAVMYFPARVATISLGVMGMLAAMLAVTGIFGMAAYSISKRWKELGIRVSLGAQLAQIVYQATPRDPLVLCGVLLTMALLGLVATWIPARRVLAVDPAQLLRDE